MRNTCTADNCNNNVHGLGYCRKHYQQYKKHGKVFKSGGKDFNEVVENKSYYELIITNNLMQEICKAKIDKEDLDKVKETGRWTIDSEGYIVNTKKRIFLHRLVMNASKGIDVDHKRLGKKFRSDNRKKYLRLATRSQNMFNIKLHKDNRSGYKGVSWNEGRKGWQARIMIRGKAIDLGVYSTAELASKSYEKAASKHQNDFAYRKKEK